MTTNSLHAKNKSASSFSAQKKLKPFLSLLKKVWKNSTVKVSSIVLMSLCLLAIGAPLFGTINPEAMDPANSNILPGVSAEFNDISGDSFTHFYLLGSDSLGRDVWSRIVYGARISLTIGVIVALLSVLIGSLIGLLSGYFKKIDSVMMRIMDGVMAIPSILFAVSLVAIFRGSIFTVIVAVTISEIPRVARLVRSVVLSVREEAYVEAAVTLGTPTYKVLLKHILPNAMAPLIIQATYICAAAMITESSLSFLGLGLPPEIATWGNIMAEGRSQFNLYPQIVLFPGVLLALTVLAINMLGDGLRDSIDPKFNKRGA